MIVTEVLSAPGALSHRVTLKWSRSVVIEGEQTRDDTYEVGTREALVKLEAWATDLLVGGKQHTDFPQPPVPALLYEGKWS